MISNLRPSIRTFNLTFKFLNVVFISFLFLLLKQVSFAEGTKQIRPLATDNGYLILDAGWSKFAFYGCPVENRLQISVCNPNEIIYFGFNQNDKDIEFRLKDKNDNVVFGPMKVPSAGTGFIPNHASAIAGPQQIVGASGYDAMKYVASAPGDYYIEFSNQNGRREFDLFDITVASPANVVIPGRVWSKAWMFSTRSFGAKFEGKLFVYADDGIVTSLDFNGMQPYVFVLSANKAGTANTGNPALDRQSKNGNVTYPQYKIFLNDPDPSCFTTGSFGNLTQPTTITGCGPTKCINIFVDKPGDIEIILDLNGVTGFQKNTTDRSIFAPVVVGKNCIAWDSKDGKGNLVLPGTDISLQVNYFNGLTNLPLFDVEAQTNGYIVELVRPGGPKPQLFWDDSQIVPPNVEKVNLTGCSKATGCHTWTWAGSDNAATDYGNTNTINTWWYANIISDTASFNMQDLMVDANTSKPPAAGNDTTVCATTATVQLFGGIVGAPTGTWSKGEGSYSPDSKTLKAVYTPSANEKSKGKAMLVLTSDPVGDCPSESDSMTIFFSPPPTADAGADQSICSNATTLQLNAGVTIATGGVWSGGNGKFLPDSAALNAVYAPSATEKSGSLTLTLTTTGNGICSPVSDDMKITFTSSPSVKAGKDTVLCNTVTSIGLNGKVTLATGGKWSGGNGSFSPDDATLNATYTPTPAEISNGSVVLTLTSTGNGNCNASTDQIKISFSGVTTTKAGSDISTCANNQVQLGGSVIGASGGTWTGGNGTFTPNASTLNARYTPTLAETEAGSLLLVLTPNSDGCTITKDSIKISFTAAPTIGAGPDKTVCSNNVQVTLGGTVSGATGVVWSSEGGGTFLPNSSALNGVYTPSADEILARVTALIITSTGNGGCAPVKDTMLILINPAQTANAGPDQSVCQNNPLIKLNGKSANTPSSKVWSGGGGTFTPGANSDTASYYPSAAELSAGFVELTYTTGKTSCNPVSDKVKITFSPPPAAEAGPAQSVCINNTNVKLSGSVSLATGGQWSGGLGSFSPNDTTLTANYKPSPAEITAGIFQLFLSTTGNGNCKPSKDSVVFTISPAPVPEAGDEQTVCSNNSVVHLNGSIPSGASGGSWSGGNGTYSANANDLKAFYTPTPGEVGAGTIKLILSTTGNGKCNAVSDTVKINFSSPPTINAGSDMTICADNASAQLNGSVTVATGGIWSGGNGTFTPNANMLNATYHPSLDEVKAGSVVLVVTSTGNANCSPVSDKMTITILPSPTAKAGANQTVCGNIASVVLNGSVTNAAGGKWTSSGTGKFSDDSQLNGSYTPSQADKTSGLVTLTLITTGNGTCNAVSDDLKINFTSTPSVGAGPDQVVCSNDVPFILKGSGSSGTWKGGLGTFSPGRNTLNASYVPTSQEITAGNLLLILATNGTPSCPSVADSVKFTFKSGPIANAGPAKVVCSNLSSIAMEGSINSPFKGIWSTTGTGSFSPNANDLNANYTFSNADKAIGFVDFTLTSVANGTCGADTSNVRITITPEPEPNAGPDQTICADVSGIQLHGIVGVAVGVEWSSSGDGSFSPSNTDLNATYQTTRNDSASGSILLTLTTNSDGVCAPKSDSKILTISPAPQVNAGPDITICGDSGVVALSGSVSVAAGGIWSSTGTGTFSPNKFSLNTRYFPSQTDVVSGKVTLTLTSEGNGNCNPVTDKLVLTITPVPAANAGQDQKVCSDAPNVLLQGTIAVSSGVIWTTTGTGAFSNAGSVNTTYTPSTADVSNGIVSLIMTSTGNGNCHPVIDKTVIIISSPLSANAGRDQTICADASGVALSGIVTGVPTGKWTSSGSGTFVPSDTALNTIYKPSTADTAAHAVTLTLTTLHPGQCTPKSDDLIVIIKPSPIVNAGPDQTVCADTSGILLKGKVINANGIVWNTTGTGTFFPNKNAFNVTYIPSPGDIHNGNGIVKFTASSTGNGTCAAAKDDLFVKITPAPTADSGSDTIVCADLAVLPLNGKVTVASGGVWLSSGNGKFLPDSLNLSTAYKFSEGDKAVGSVLLTLETAGNGTCRPVKDLIAIKINALPIVKAGPDATICASVSSIALTGNVTTAGGGAWSTSGSGIFSPGNTDLHPTYLLSSADRAAAKLTFVLTSFGNGVCNAVKDTMTIIVNPIPHANAGADQQACTSSNGVVLNGAVTAAAGGLWVSSGNGTFSPNASALNATYLPSEDDKAAASVKLSLYTTGNGSCTPSGDDMTITIVSPPTAGAGPDVTICADREYVQINGAATNATKTVWSTSGKGFFSPGNDTTVTNYIPSMSDRATGKVILTLQAMNGSNCKPISDQMTIFITPAPTLNAGPDQMVCPDVSSVQLQPLLTLSTGAVWSSTGTGTFNPGPDNAKVQYIPSADDITAGSVSFSIATTGNGTCNALYDSVKVSFTGVPKINAGPDKTVCTSAFPIHLEGSGTTGSWSGWNGSMDPDSDNLNALYTPSPGEVSAGFVQLILTSSTTGTCPPSKDTVVITLPVGPNVDAGGDQELCSNTSVITTNGSILKAGGGVWTTSGSGTFTDDEALAATYNPSEADKTGGYVVLTLTSTNNLSCEPAKDVLIIDLVPAPVAHAGLDQTICADATGVDLSGVVDNAISSVWTSLPGGGAFDDNGKPATKFMPAASDITAGLVKLILKANGASGCPDNTDTLNIKITPAVKADAGSDQTLCADVASVKLIGSVTTAGGIVWSSSGSGTFSPGPGALHVEYIPSADDTASGSVNLFVNTVDNGNCSPAFDVVQLLFTPTPKVNAGPDQIICASTKNISLNASVAVASGGQWSSSGTGTFNPDDTKLNASYNLGAKDKNAGGALLTLTSTGNGTCKPVSDYLKITVLPVPDAIVNAGLDKISCASEQAIDLSGVIKIASGGKWTTSGTGNFLPDATSLKIQYIPSSKDTADGKVSIALTSTGNGPCIAASDTMELSFVPAPSSDAGSPQTICADSAFIQLDGKITNASSAFWSSSGSGSFSPSSNMLNAVYTPSESDRRSGKVGFTLTTSASGVCEDANSAVILNITPAPTIEAGPDDSICASSGQFDLHGSKTVAKGSVWLSSGSGTFDNELSLITFYTPTENDKDAGVILIKLRSIQNGTCKPVVDQLKLTIVPSPSVNAGPDQTICADATEIQLSGSVSTATGGIWTTSGSGTFAPSANVLNPAYIPSDDDIQNKIVILTLQSAGAHNCDSITDDVLVSILPKPRANTGNAVACDLLNGAVLNATISFAEGGQWVSSGTGTFSPDPFTLNAKYVPSAEDTTTSVTLTLTSTGNGSCHAAVSSTVLIVSPRVTADAGRDRIVCRGSSSLLVAKTAQDVTYSWTSSQGDTIAHAEFATVVANADTLFALNAINQYGCMASDTVKVLVIDPPSFDMVAHFCFSDSLLIDSKPQNLPLVNGLFQWSRAGKNLMDENKSVIYPDRSGKYKIVYAYGSCQVLDTTNVTAPPQLLPRDRFACLGDSTLLSTPVEPKVGYVWSLGNAKLSDINPFLIKVAPDTNTYRVVAIDSVYGCTNSAKLRVIGLPKPIFNLNDTIACNKDTIVLNGRPTNFSNLDSLHARYIWKKGNQVIDTTNFIKIISSEIYKLTVTVEVCSNTDSSKAIFNPLPLALPLHEDEFCKRTDQSIILVAGNEPGVKYNWQDSPGNHTNKDTVENAGVYYVTLTNQYNCVAKDSIRILDLCRPELYVPSAFMPGQSQEPLFKVFGKDFTNFRITVFSRWGEIIYYSEDRNEYWDGVYRGRLMPIGVYPYLITYEGQAKKYKGPYKQEGTITIVR